MKAARIQSTQVEFRVWCEHCRVRVAPTEERTVVRNNTYHPNCYLKMNAKAKA